MLFVINRWSVIMNHAAQTQRTRRFSLEAVPTSHGQYQAVFRIHLDGALSADDEMHFGEVSDSPLKAFDNARALAVTYLAALSA
jgi:hypothetical protein